MRIHFALSCWRWPRACWIFKRCKREHLHVFENFSRSICFNCIWLGSNVPAIHDPSTVHANSWLSILQRCSRCRRTFGVTNSSDTLIIRRPLVVCVEDRPVGICRLQVETLEWSTVPLFCHTCGGNRNASVPCGSDSGERQWGGERMASLAKMESSEGVTEAVPCKDWLAGASKHYLCCLSDRKRARRLLLQLCMTTLKKRLQERANLALYYRKKDATPVGNSGGLHHSS